MGEEYMHEVDLNDQSEDEIYHLQVILLLHKFRDAVVITLEV